MRFEDTWLIVISAIIAAATVAGAILFVIARNQNGQPANQLTVPSLSEEQQEGIMPVEESITRVVYFLSPSNPYRLKPVEREVFNLIPQSRLAGQVLQELIKGPQQGDGAYAPLPSRTRLKGIYISEKGMAVVMLNQATRLDHPGGTAAELMSIHSIVSTLCVNFPLIQSVQIVIENAPDNTFAGHIDISYPFIFEEEYITGISAAPDSNEQTPTEEESPGAAPGNEATGPDQTENDNAPGT